MKWRIYRLPGSKKLWHIDSGEGTQVINVYGYDCFCPSKTVDKENSTTMPHAWIEVTDADLHIINGFAEFSLSEKAKAS